MLESNSKSSCLTLFNARMMPGQWKCRWSIESARKGINQWGNLHLSTREVTDSWWPCTCYFHSSLSYGTVIPGFSPVSCSLAGDIVPLPGTSFLSQWSFISLWSGYSNPLSMSKSVLHHCSTKCLWKCMSEVLHLESDSVNFSLVPRIQMFIYISFEFDANGLLKGLGPEHTLLKSSGNL